MRSFVQRRAFVLVPLLALAVSPLLAHGADEEKDEASSSKLPLKTVVMFSSGVGFFEHNGSVTDNDEVELKFNVDDINDLLKSMVLQDLGGGRISTVTYGSRDPITKALQTFAIDLTSEPTLGDLLRQIRGERVELEAPTKITGKILGVESRQVQIGDDKTVEKKYLNLVTDGGLRSVAMDTIVSIRLLDAKLNRELQQALEVLAMGNATDKKSVTLNFLGQGERRVRVGYIQEAPIWKTSYRLVLGQKDEAPLLQGWAIVENTTEDDWENVDLTLVSGRPISFIMDLYEPLYVKRPVVEPELYASLRPQTYDQDLAQTEQEFAEKKAGNRANEPQSRQLARRSRPQAAMEDRAFRSEIAEGLAAADAAPFDPSSGVESMAQATDVGELFRYKIATPVDLARQTSAMLPIVNESVEAEKVSIYNQAVQAKHPLNGLRFKNTTELNLMQGPVTVFDGGVYAGDARIEDLQPGTERLLSYALDLETEVSPESKPHPQSLVTVRIVRGTLHVTRKQRRETVYTVKNSGDAAKTVLIEKPVDPSWNLIEPAEPTEKTRGMYRFAVEAQPGEPETLSIVEEMTINEQFALTNLDLNTIVYYKNADVTSEKTKAALAEVVERQQAINNLSNEIAQLQNQIQIVSQEQERIRQNMAQLDRNTDLYNRYVKKFGEQEDQVEKHRAAVAEKEAERTKLQQELNDYLQNLNLE